jgi:hypothetical protein
LLDRRSSSRRPVLLVAKMRPKGLPAKLLSVGICNSLRALSLTGIGGDFDESLVSSS